MKVTFVDETIERLLEIVDYTICTMEYEGYPDNDTVLMSARIIKRDVMRMVEDYEHRFDK